MGQQQPRELQLFIIHLAWATWPHAIWAMGLSSLPSPPLGAWKFELSMKSITSPVERALGKLDPLIPAFHNRAAIEDSEARTPHLQSTTSARQAQGVERPRTNPKSTLERGALSPFGARNFIVSLLKWVISGLHHLFRVPLAIMRSRLDAPRPEGRLQLTASGCVVAWRLPLPLQEPVVVPGGEDEVDAWPTEGETQGNLMKNDEKWLSRTCHNANL